MKTEEQRVDLREQLMIGMPGRQFRSKVERQLSLSQVRPDAPRGVRVQNRVLLWDAPQDPRGVTHYNIYVDDDSTVVRQIPAAQTRCQDYLRGRRFYVASFNQPAQQVSHKALYDAGSTITIGGRDVSITDFGGVGDGVTDNWNAFRAAMVALKIAGGGRLLVPFGRYRITYSATDATRTNTTGVMDFSPWNNGGTWTATTNIEIYFENGATLFMDNLMPNGYDAQTHALFGRCRWLDGFGAYTPLVWNGYAINYGAITCTNVRVEWTLGSQRGIGDSFRFTGTKSEETAPYDLLLQNCSAYNAPQVGVIFMGCKNARTLDFYSENCWADTAHFNANGRHCSATNTRAENSKDDTVALVTYFPDAITLARGLDTEAGPFTSPDQLTMNNNGIVVDGVRKMGSASKANGVRLLGANGAIVNNVYVDAGSGPEIGASVWAGSVKANGTTLAESGLAPIACQVTNVTARNGVQVGVHLVSQGTDGSEGDSFLKNDVIVDGIHANDCVQASIWGDNCKGFRIKNAKSDSVKCDLTNAWEFGLELDSAGDVFITGTATDYALLDMNTLPLRNIHLDRIKIDGGKLVITDVNKITAKQIEILNSPSSSVEGVRVLNFMCPEIRVVNPNRSGTVALENIPVRCIPGRDWDVHVDVIHDNTPVQNLIEIGGGDAYNVSRDIRMSSVLTHTVAALSTDPYEIQGGLYAPVNVTRRSRARKSGTWTNVNIDEMPLQSGVLDLFANGVNLGARVSPTNSVGAWLVERSAVAGGGYLVCTGYNAKFDGTNWVTGTDGASNGGALVAVNYGDGNIQFYAIPSTGGSVQTIPHASLITYRRGFIETNGKLTMVNLKATGQAGAKPARFNVDGDVQGGTVDVGAAADIAFSGGASGDVAKWDGTKFVPFSSDANRIAVLNGSGKLAANAALTPSLVMATDGAGMPSTISYSDIANGLESALLALGFIDDTALAAYTYSEGEIDTLLLSKADAAAYGLHTHTTDIHTHGGVTAGTDTSGNGGGGATSAP